MFSSFPIHLSLLVVSPSKTPNTLTWSSPFSKAVISTFQAHTTDPDTSNHSDFMHTFLYSQCFKEKKIKKPKHCLHQGYLPCLSSNSNTSSSSYFQVFNFQVLFKYSRFSKKLTGKEVSFLYSLTSFSTPMKTHTKQAGKRKLRCDFFLSHEIHILTLLC